MDHAFESEIRHILNGSCAIGAQRARASYADAIGDSRRTLVAEIRQRNGLAYVPLFAVVPPSAAIFAAVCMWPSQRFSNGAGMPNWSSTRATMWLTMSSIDCG